MSGDRLANGTDRNALNVATERDVFEVETLEYRHDGPGTIKAKRWTLMARAKYREDAVAYALRVENPARVKCGDEILLETRLFRG